MNFFIIFRQKIEQFLNHTEQTLLYYYTLHINCDKKMSVKYFIKSKELSEWALKHSCHPNSKILTNLIDSDSELIEYALLRGFTFSPYSAAAVVRKNNENLFQIIKDLNVFNSYVLYEAVKHNSTMIKEVIKKCRENTTSYMEQTLRIANLDVIKMIIEEFNWKEKVFLLSSVCKGGNLEIVKFLEDKYHVLETSPILTFYMQHACESGNLELVKYLNTEYVKEKIYYGMELNPILHRNMNALYMKCRSMPIFEYLFENNYKWIDHIIIYYCISSGTEFVKYAMLRGASVSSKQFLFAIRHGPLEMIKLLEIRVGKKYKNNPKVINSSINRFDKSKNDITIMQYLCDSGYVVTYDHLITIISINYHNHLKYILTKYKLSLIDKIKLIILSIKISSILCLNILLIDEPNIDYLELYKIAVNFEYIDSIEYLHDLCLSKNINDAQLKNIVINKKLPRISTINLIDEITKLASDMSSILVL
jgi:hypothetical protein